MTLHLVRLSVDLDALARAADQRGWTAGRRLAFDEGAALHHLLTETFGRGVLQPFRLSVAPRRARGSLYAYTETEPASLSETAAMAAMPEVVAALSPTLFQAKAMPTGFSVGRCVGFDVRICPTTRLLKDIPAVDGSRDSIAKGAEIDTFLAEALRHEDRDHMTTIGRTREAVYCDWLAERLAGIAKLEKARLASFRRRTSARGGKAFETPDAVLHGTLSIEDPDRFVERLTKGVGRHRAYGYGMLLLRPPSPRRRN